MSNLEKAKILMKKFDYTCVICSDEETFTSRKRGVSQLLAWLDEGKSLKSYSVSDKVVGNGAAFLYILLQVKELHANVISKNALETLNRYKIEVTYNTITEAIRNRDNTGLCPIETEVAGITSPYEALTLIRSKLRQMEQRT